MKAGVCTRYGPLEALRLDELATPVPRGNEVRIRIRATAVTSSDCYVRGLDLSLAYQLMAPLALGWNAPRQPVRWTALDAHSRSGDSPSGRF